MTFLFRSLVMFATVFAAIRVLGKRTMANFTPMDRVAGITFGTVAGSTAITQKVPLYGGVLVVAAFAVIAWIIGRAALSFPSLRPLLMGTPRPLVVDGKVSPKDLKKAGMGEKDLEMRLREAKIAGPDQIQVAELEIDGKLGIIPKNS
ncbi:DUF421 domain-containing protein [Sulfobacillus harzensis]|uniref:DUF421 domain-containing protein n=1 Tax=Sulfobacillus harzensis TaxID=2729629 RepID=A0A7Y0L162_9FIRM|nr:YetF domain-containing protein [Sulfobacillus harzensis]NMP21097.1 DUF421 domain-containing protein [Sulfobacillus harzensis]